MSKSFPSSGGLAQVPLLTGQFIESEMAGTADYRAADARGNRNYDRGAVWLPSPAVE